MMRDLFSPARLGGVLIITLASLAFTSAQADAQHDHDLTVAPAGLIAAIAKTQAKAAAKDPAYAIADNGCASLEAGPKGHALSGCFTKTGPAFAHGKQRISLHLAAWGRAGHLQPVSLERTAPKANRIAYRGRHVSEWWRVLPMGYEQGFTIDRAPQGQGRVVLQLQASRTPTLEHGTLAWGDFHYGKLHVVDAAGKALPAQLSARGRTVTLAFDARHAQYPVTVDPLVWLQAQTLNDPGTGADHFGYSVALSGDGATALVGAYGTTVSGNRTAGAAYVYELSSGTWTQVAAFTDPAAAFNDFFGYAVALDKTGTTALVGAYGTSSNAGAVYVYKAGSGWSGVSSPTATLTDPPAAANDWFGASVALSSDGKTAVIGAPETTLTKKGAAYVYTAGSGWSGVSAPTATFADPAAASYDYFGWAVALDSAGATALVGANGTNSSAGAAYVFTGGSGWSGVSAPTATFTDPAAASSDNFGSSVALSGDGKTALVGAYGTNSSAGAAYVYTGGSGWSAVSSPAATLTDPAATSSDGFGSSVALDATGAIALVGASSAIFNASTSSAGPGRAYVFAQPSAGWADTSTPDVTLSDPAATAGDRFGGSVALDSTGATALVGAEYTNARAGAAYAYTGASLSAVLNVPASVAAATQYSADYIVTNNGTAASGDVQVQIPVPGGATYVGSSSTQGSCTYNSTTQVASCDLGSIAGSGTMATAGLTLKSGATAGTVTQTASLANGSPNLAQTASTSVVSSSGTSSSTSSTSSSGGGGAIGLWALLGLLGLAGAVRRGSTCPV